MTALGDCWFMGRHPAVRLSLLATAGLCLSLAGESLLSLAIIVALFAVAPRGLRGPLLGRWATAQLLLFPGVLVAFSLTALERQGDVASRAWWCLESALRYGLRLGGLLLASLVLVRTLSSRELMALLRLLRIPATIATLVTTVLRFVPDVMDETRRVVRAQRCRGWRLRGPGSLAALAVPLVVGAMKRAHETAILLEVRRIDTSEPRLPRLTLGDWAVALIPCSAPLWCWVLSSR